MRKPKRKTKALRNNLRRWYELVNVTEGNFLFDFTEIQRAYGLPLNKLDDYGQICLRSGLEKANSVKDEAYKIRVDYLNKLKEDNRLNGFLKSVVKLLHKYNLGNNWLTTILDCLISFFTLPPRHNLLFYQKGNDFVIELNPNTTLNEIKEAWQDIEPELKRIYPANKRKKRYYGEKEMVNIERLAKDWHNRMKEKYGDLTGFDASEYKKYQRADLDRVVELFADEEDVSREADRKRVARLRTARSRHRKNYKN